MYKKMALNHPGTPNNKSKETKLLSALNNAASSLRKYQKELKKRVDVHKQIVANDCEVLLWLGLQQEGEKKNSAHQAPQIKNTNQATKMTTLEEVIARAKRIESQSVNHRDFDSKVGTDKLSPLIALKQESSQLISSLNRWEEVCVPEPWQCEEDTTTALSRSVFQDKCGNNGGMCSQIDGDILQPDVVEKLALCLTRDIESFNDNMMNSLRQKDKSSIYMARYRARHLQALSDTLCEQMCRCCSVDISTEPSRPKEMNFDKVCLRGIPTSMPVHFDDKFGAHRSHAVPSPAVNSSLGAVNGWVEKITQEAAITGIRTEVGADLLSPLLFRLKELVVQSQSAEVADMESVEWEEALRAWKLTETVLSPHKSRTGFFQVSSQVDYGVE